MNRSDKGFPLIELLIAVAIILIIAAIAIPSLLRSRMAANEASAVGSVCTINTAEITYSSLRALVTGMPSKSERTGWPRETNEQIQDSENIVTGFRISRSCSRMWPSASTQSSISYVDRHIPR